MSHNQALFPFRASVVHLFALLGCHLLLCSFLEVFSDLGSPFLIFLLLLLPPVPLLFCFSVCLFLLCHGFPLILCRYLGPRVTELHTVHKVVKASNFLIRLFQIRR
ncbi:hypothetical protein B0T16DRAFT_171172 [Cercophora newfieldiana]|uniref:Uncharacterized protein n=1 Tax=Cercophora newfieldiana TaxID=92897 RepID=A0AA39Y6H7_9PEZI|nr:hypothetical protein B0T16DRAFT_171172 [Cercophora newfieldiana]